MRARASLQLTYSLNPTRKLISEPFLLTDYSTNKPANMPVSRMRMRPWLEMMIDSNNINGLTWVDKEKTMFSIPWKHAARHGWEMDKDACLFKEWAKHTGKYVEGQDSDPKTWKANFRCAMNSLPDIEEVKHKSINKGHQAMRVFRMLPPTQKSKVKRSRVKPTKSDEMRKYKMEESDYSDSQSPMSSSSEEAESTQESTVDSTVNTELNGYPVAAEVPDWCHSVEIGAETTYYPRFEVSPEHCTEDSYIMEICEQLEKEANATFNMLNNGSFLSNGPGTSPSMSSSDSSASDLDELPSYINLGAGSSASDSVWDSFLSPFAC